MKNQAKNTVSKITKKTNLAQLVMEHTHLAQVLIEDYGLHCAFCFAASFDTLEQGAKIHGMDDKEIEDLVKRLNQINRDFYNKKTKKG